jgi:hypothetical protein
MRGDSRLSFSFSKFFGIGAKPASPLDNAWNPFLAEQVVQTRLLDHEEMKRLRMKAGEILEEKHFEACGGFQMKEQARIAIAAQAALLQLNADFGNFPKLKSILIYPDAFIIEDAEEDPAGVVVEEESVLLGESSSMGAVAFSWRQVERDSRFANGRNVVLHEFAHQIDQGDGAADGWPAHLDPQWDAQWQEVMAREFDKLQDDLHHERRTPLDPYGAEHPAEFFATLTELFFEKPRQMIRVSRDLYDLFAAFYGQDPAARFNPDGSPRFQDAF